MRAGQLEAETRLERIDHLLPVGDRDGGLGSDLRAHHRERRLELEQLGERHSPPGLPKVFIRLRLVTQAHRVRHVHQPMPLADLLGQHVFEPTGERQRRLDPAGHLATAEAIDQVVLRHETTDA